MSISPTTGQSVNLASAATSLAFAAGTLTNGQLVAVCIAILTTTVSVSSISDGSNTYTLQSSANSGTSVRTEIWTAPITAATGSRTITINFSGSTLASAAYEEYAGVSSIGNIGTTATGTSTYAEGDVATQDGNNWSVCAIAVASSSGDTFTADLGTIRQSKIPALTTAGVGLIDNTSVGVVGALRNAILLSTSRAWAAAAIELRSGGSAINVTESSIPAPVGGGLEGSHHQIVKPPAVITFTPPYFSPVPVAVNLAGGLVGAVYSETISAQGGTSPYTYALTSGSLPAGTTLTSSTGVIAGTLTTAATSTFTIQVTDANGFTGTQNFQIIVSTPSGGGYAFTFLS
jgi:hypothetical protein